MMNFSLQHINGLKLLIMNKTFFLKWDISCGPMLLSSSKKQISCTTNSYLPVRFAMFYRELIRFYRWRFFLKSILISLKQNILCLFLAFNKTYIYATMHFIILIFLETTTSHHLSHQYSLAPSTPL